MSEVVSETAEAEPREWLRTNPLAIVVSAFQGLRNAILPIAAVIFGSNSFGGGAAFVVPIIVAIAGISVLSAWVNWWRLRYRVGSSDIKVEKGLISRSARSVPYERIQDVSLEQGLIPRLLGLVEVRFETGAGGKDELKLAFVSMDEGERLREVVRDLQDGVADGEAAQEVAGLTEPTEETAIQPSGQVLFSMGPKRLFLFGMFEFSLVVFAVLGGAAQQLDFLLPFEIWDFDQWQSRLGGPGDWLASLGWGPRIVGAIMGAAMLSIVGMLTGILRTFLRDFDFRLEQTPKGFRRRRGLLTKTDVVMPAHRVQAATVTTGMLRRIWGWHGLSFVSLAQDAKSANHVVAPFAQMQEIAPIIDAAQFSLPGEGLDWHRPSKDYRFDTALLGALIPGLLGIVILIAGQAAWANEAWRFLPGLGLFALAGFIAVQQHFLWRFERHALDARQILSRRGWLAPKLEIANRVKLHSVEISQGPLAKWRGYANLKYGLAGGTLSFSGLPLAEAEEMRRAVLSSIAEVDFSRISR